MRPTFRTIVAVCALAGMALWVGYLHFRVDAVIAQSWDAGVQRDELTLRHLRTLEALLQDGRVDDAVLELQHSRQHTLTRLSYAATGYARDSNVRAYALRVFCGEMPVELPASRNGGEEAGDRMIRAAEQLCDRGRG